MAIDTFLKSDTFSGRFFNSLFKGKLNLYLTISRSFISCKEVESGKFWGLRYLIELKSRPALYRPNFRPISKRRFSALQCQYRHEIYRTPSRRGLEPLWKISRPQLFRFRNYERVNKAAIIDNQEFSGLAVWQNQECCKGFFSCCFWGFDMFFLN